MVSAAGFELEAFGGRPSPLPKSRAKPRDLKVVVSAAGFEPATHALKEGCYDFLSLCSQSDSLASVVGFRTKTAVFGA